MQTGFWTKERNHEIITKLTAAFHGDMVTCYLNKKSTPLMGRMMSNSTWVTPAPGQLTDNLFKPFQPSAEQVKQLIDAARKHPLGVEFLLEGDLGAVAITFQTHALTVDAARHQLKELDS